MPSAPSSSATSVVVHDLSFSWPDGIPALRGVSGAFGRGRTGLVGLNGAGKSTLLKLISGRLRPSGGSIQTAGTIDYLAQDLAVRADATLAELLGVRPALDAVRRITAGEVSPELFDLVGDDWDVEERSVAALAAAGLPSELDRPVAALSGGEVMLAAVTGVRLRGASVALLDEPSNNLDRQARSVLHRLVREWRGALIVVSHDLELLELMDDTAELRDGGLTVFGGPYSAYRAYLDEQQAAARQSLRAAEQRLRVEKRDRIAADTKLARSARDGANKRESGVYTKAAFDQKKNSGEKTAARVRGIHSDREADARAAVDAAERAVRDDDRIVIDLPDPDVPARRRIATVTDASGRVLELQGPERVALLGDNGVGKSTLLAQLTGHPDASAVATVGGPTALARTERIGHLTQRLGELDDAETVLDAVRAAAPAVPPGELRNRLARFLIRGAMVERAVGTLSGGERFRLALARLLLTDPPAQLLVLDEPTNNLDVASIEQLVAALSGYRGALIVVSHDRAFLDRLGLTREWELRRDGTISDRMSA